MQLNDEQQAVVSAGEGAWCAVAGPGSGKSSCLIARYSRLIREGVSADQILSLSFTKSAAKNLRDRAEEAVGVQKMDRCAGFSTFHSLALSFATEERDNFPFKLTEFPLATEPQANKMAYEAGRRFEVDVRSLRPWISLRKRQRITPSQAVKQAETDGRDEKMALAYKAYDRSMREAGVLDFDSLITEMVNLLEKNTEVRGRWQYRYIMADESQDNSALEWRLLQLLSEEHGNVLCVGDPGQSLFSFRGSDSEQFLRMSELFPNCQTLYLGRNHRSTRQIVNLCKQYGPIPELAERFHTHNGDGPEPTVTGYPSAQDEAKAVIATVQKIDSKQHHTVAVLARTNAALRPVEDQLAIAGIRYHYIGRSGFWAQPEIKALLGYLACVVGANDNAVLTALRAPFWPTKFLRKKELADNIKKRQSGDPNKPSAYKILAESTDKHTQSFVHFLYTLTRYRKAEPKKALVELMRDLRAEDYYAEEQTADNNPVDNLKELVRIAQRFSTIKEFLDYARKVTAASKSKKGVCLATVHASKGLEWNTVHLIAVQDGVLPHSRAESLAEERNIFFVGLSRAERELHISYAGVPSGFLTPLLPKKQEVDRMMEEVFSA